MKDTATVPRSTGDQDPPPLVGPELADELLGRAQAGGVLRRVYARADSCDGRVTERTGSAKYAKSARMVPDQAVIPSHGARVLEEW